MKTQSKVACPECEKKFSPRGLPGHRRFVHGVTETGKSKPESAESDDEGSLGGLAAVSLAVVGALVLMAVGNR